MVANVGDEEIQDAFTGAISVNLYDDPKDDEINGWRGEKINYLSNALPYKRFAEIERLAIQEARRLHQADLDAVKIAAHESQP